MKRRKQEERRRRERKEQPGKRKEGMKAASHQSVPHKDTFRWLVLFLLCLGDRPKPALNWQEQTTYLHCSFYGVLLLLLSWSSHVRRVAPDTAGRKTAVKSGKRGRAERALTQPLSRFLLFLLANRPHQSFSVCNGIVSNHRRGKSKHVLLPCHRSRACHVQLQLLNAIVCLALLASSLLPSMSLALVSCMLFRRRDALLRSCRRLLSAPPLPKSGATLHIARRRIGLLLPPLKRMSREAADTKNALTALALLMKAEVVRV